MSEPEPPEARQLRPSPHLGGMSIYHPPSVDRPIDLRLDANEGRAPAGLLERLLGDGEALRRYPRKDALERLIAEQHGVGTRQVLVTAGVNGGIDRACRALLAPGRNLVLPWPSFEMFDRFAQLAGAEVRRVDWGLDAPYPLEQVLAASDAETGAIAVISPNNPTGQVVSADALRRLAAARPGALLIVDLAYGEFADTDLTPAVLELDNAIALHTLSKAWGLAGLRIGYALGPARVLDWMRVAGQPYPVARPALALAHAWLREGRDQLAANVAQVRRERTMLAEQLRRLGAEPIPSQANFILCRFADPAWVKDALAGQGIAVRSWLRRPGLEHVLRLSLPGEGEELSRLAHALETALAPQALFLTPELLSPGGGPDLSPLAARLPLAVVGADAESRLVSSGQGELVRCVADDAQPGPEPFAGALRSLDVERAWVLATTPAQVQAARAAGLLPLGVGLADALLRAGAARVLAHATDAVALLPGDAS